MTFQTFVVKDVRTLPRPCGPSCAERPQAFVLPAPTFAVPSLECARPIRWRTGVPAQRLADCSSIGLTPPLKTHRDVTFPTWLKPA